MKNVRHIAFLNLPFCLLAFLAYGPLSDVSAQNKALIIDGQNNHSDWPKTTVMMKHYLKSVGGFDVSIARTQFVWNGDARLKEFPLDDGKPYEIVKRPKADPDFAPDFAQFDVVISNFGYNAAPWPEATRKSLEKYVKGGGGLVIVHAANNSFGNWGAFNEMIGLGGWGGRDEKSGPFVYFDQNEKLVRDTSPGRGGGHGPQHEFEIVVRDTQHPITRGLPTAWLHTKDELYHGLRGPAENMTVLATAFSAKKFGGTDRHEPMVMTIEHGQGRVFHTPMGHADYSMECVGFITLLVRGSQWAATQKVTMDQIPKDFPTRDRSSSRPFKAR